MRYTLAQFLEQFPDEDSCLDRMFEQRYGDVKHCPKCVAETKFYRVKGRKCYACMHCGYQLHPLAQTIFHKSSTALKSWFYAIYLFSVSKNGVSAKEIERHVGVTYKTAHRMAKQIRSLMSQSGTIGGPGAVVEADETFIGGKAVRRPGWYDKKATVIGAVQRGGKAQARVTSGANASTALPFLRAAVGVGSTIMTDDSRIYKKLKQEYSHGFVNHSAKEYVQGLIHTNSIEGFWGQLKRSIDGTYHCVSKKYLQLYVDEFVFRYNFRDVVVYPVLLELAARRVVPVR